MSADRVDAAIAAAAQPAVRMERFEGVVGSTRRPIAIDLPADATDAELAEFCGWVLTGLLAEMRRRRAAAAGPASRILVPS